MPDRANHRLNSWKEIAEYCSRDVRTVLRWEKKRGLPTYRIPGGGRVFAYTAELEQWLHNGSQHVLLGKETAGGTYSKNPTVHS